tara:strand:- start:8320 stop:8511 length:192 start_codon:yes stop_codon:yes gene_type:complete
LEHADIHLAIGGPRFQGETVFTKQQIMDLYEISDAIIKRYLNSHAEELKNNDYFILIGKTQKF